MSSLPNDSAGNLPPGPPSARDADSAHPTSLGHAGSGLVRRIALDLACVNCGYDLKGIDVDHACPECGIPVRDTVLYLVAPARSRFEPLRDARTLTLGYTGCAFFVLLAAICLWIPELSSFLHVIVPASSAPTLLLLKQAVILSPCCALLAWLCAALLRRPTLGASPPRYDPSLRYARLGLLAWALVCGAAIILSPRINSDGPTLWSQNPSDVARIAFRLTMNLAAVLAIRASMPVVAFISLRSVTHRAGKTNRQGFKALLFSLYVVLAGDALQGLTAIASALFAAAARFDTLDLLGTTLVVVGFFMLTLALFNEFIDSIRIRRAILRPHLNEAQILTPPLPVTP